MILDVNTYCRSVGKEVFSRPNDNMTMEIHEQWYEYDIDVTEERLHGGTKHLHYLSRAFTRKIREIVLMKRYHLIFGKKLIHYVAKGLAFSFRHLVLFPYPYSVTTIHQNQSIDRLVDHIISQFKTKSINVSTN